MSLEKPFVLIVEGTDGTGKTEISQALASEYCVPYFKVSTERQNWHADTFRHSLYFDAVLPQFILATRTSFVSDRGFPSEFVYPHVLGRTTNHQLLYETDRAFAELGAIIVVCRRRSYENVRADDLVTQEQVVRLDRGYGEFMRWTACKVIEFYVDDHGDDLKQQIPVLFAQIEKKFHE